MNSDAVLLVMGRNASLKFCYLTTYFWDIFWPECKYEKILCTQTEEGECKNHFDRIIYTDEEMIWGDRLKSALDSITSKYVFLVPEDFFVSNYIDSKQVEVCLEVAEKYQAGAIRLSPSLVKGKKFEERDYEILPQNSLYRITLTPTLFRTDYLKLFSVQHFSPWQFERLGTEESNKYDDIILSVRKPVYNYVHAWSHNSWSKKAIRLMKKHNVPANYYVGDNIYSLKQSLFDMMYMISIKLAPKLVNKAAITKANKGEKKLNW